MKKWLQKILVIFVAFITFGIISPNHEIWELLESDQSANSKSELSDNQIVDHSIAEHHDENSDRY